MTENLNLNIERLNDGGEDWRGRRDEEEPY
jgi:hypothetical protein